MTSRRLTHDDITAQLQDLPHWVTTGEALHARHDAPDVPTAIRLIAQVFEVAEEMDHHPDADVRWRRLRWQLSTHDAPGITQLDIELAHRITELAAGAGATPLAARPVVVEIGIDTTDVERILPFWQAALDFQPVTEDGFADALVDPGGLGPRVWFQQTDSPAPGRNRLHVDVTVGVADADQRRQAVEAAGGRLVTAEFAPSWWVYADPDGNEVCISTEIGRAHV